jgi:hypothetical protein
MQTLLQAEPHHVAVALNAEADLPHKCQLAALMLNRNKTQLNPSGPALTWRLMI